MAKAAAQNAGAQGAETQNAAPAASASASPAHPAQEAEAYEIVVKGLPSGYEVEHLCRVFYPAAKVRAARGNGIFCTKGPLLYARAGKTRLAAALRTPRGQTRLAFAPAPQSAAEAKLALCRLLYGLLQRQTGLRPPWGLLTGVRPVSLLRKRRAAHGKGQARRLFLQEYCVSQEKYQLAADILDRQAPILEKQRPPACSLYVSIPFCPSRCTYCSFVSQSVAGQGALIPPYLEALARELQTTARVMAQSGLALANIYIGGGTPTALSAPQLEQLLRAVEECFDTAALAEYTVEAGRPDCTTPEKLAVLKAHGVRRVSINPQSMRDEVLRAIGRHHTAADITRCYADARKLDFESINMDLIAGLPGDDAEGFARTLTEVLALAPENVTLHTLTLKRAADLRREAYSGAAPAAMLAAAYPKLAAAGYAPYYLYRQKSSVDNLENTGWAKPGCESPYNICIMEEAHSILACGAGAVTKLVSANGAKIKRSYNYKYPKEYIDNLSEVLNRKQGVNTFYAGNLDTETTG